MGSKVKSMGKDSKSRVLERRKKIKEQYSQKKKILTKYLKSAPFTRLSDKLTFIFGVLLVIFHSFVLGRYPNNGFYNYHSLTLTVLVFGKWVYYKSLGWHYYMSDFCYYANFLMIIFLMFYPKNDYLFKSLFLFSNGNIAIAVAAFRNQMVFHKFDNLSSLALHIYPQLVTWNLRWFTMEYELTLPEDQRRFVTLDTTFSWYRFIVIPTSLYFVWIFCYFLINFVFAAKRIRERNYDNMFNYYCQKKWAHKILYQLGPKMAPAIFLSIHFAFFLVTHFGSIICMYSYEFHTLSIVIWLTWSIWNASCFYMDYFSKKYEASLQRLEEVEQQLNE